MARTRSALSHSLPPPQVEEVCGDLYPSKNEREVILSAIQAFCGPPESKVAGETAYFDNWKGADQRKHKGASVGDLERARINPSKYGVTGKADHRGQRPPRPSRVPAPVSAKIAVAAIIPEAELLTPLLTPQLHAGGQLQQQAPQPPSELPELPAGITTETGPAVGADEPEEVPAMCAMGEDEEATVLRQIQEQEAAVTAQQEKEKAKKEAAAKARKLKVAEAKAAKEKAAKEKVWKVAASAVANSYPPDSYPPDSCPSVVCRRTTRVNTRSNAARTWQITKKNWLPWGWTPRVARLRSPSPSHTRSRRRAHRTQIQLLDMWTWTCGHSTSSYPVVL